jgi:hypothetical protein
VAPARPPPERRFSQRFSASLSADGRSIAGAWEKLRDDTTWEHDFDMIYTKLA